jgi:hypothetical protein
METSGFTTTLVVDQTPKEVFEAINNVRGWWSEEIEGNSEKLNDVFNYHYEDLHRCQMNLSRWCLTRKSFGLWVKTILVSPKTKRNGRIPKSFSRYLK